MLGWIVVNSPNWPLVRDAFFNAKYFWRALPYVAQGFVVNIQLFLVSEVLVLIVGLGIALMRTRAGAGLPAAAAAGRHLLRLLPRRAGRPVHLPVRASASPRWASPACPTTPFVLGVMTLVLLYSAYVAEVYRAGLESVHPSQEAAARSLGLSRAQALRYVVVPQAVRRVIPPLLNDFIGLQKDTALVSFIGVVEVFRQSQIQEAATFNFTPYLASAALFLLITVPLTRVVDILIARDRRRLLAAAR